MKYRVKEIGIRFYPQVRKSFIWWNITGVSGCDIFKRDFEGANRIIEQYKLEQNVKYYKVN